MGEITIITKKKFVGSVNQTFTILMTCGGADVLARVNGSIFFFLSLPAAYNGVNKKNQIPIARSGAL